MPANKNRKKILYADNAATTWPKPVCVLKTMQKFFFSVGANPGRSGHRMSIAAARILFQAREEIAQFFAVKHSQNVVFTLNATQALNIAIKGTIKPGAHVIVSSFEHNSVMRPLNYLKNNYGVTMSAVPPSTKCAFDLTAFENAFQDNTQMVIINHASNVTGAILPVRKIGSICKNKNVPLLVDAAQTAGIVPVNMQKDLIDILVFTGHKGLLGPQGTGGLCVGDNIDIDALFQGGTGSRSEYELHPEFMPDKLEAGTPNIIGIAGLRAGIQYLLKSGLDNIAEKEKKLAEKLIKGLSANNKIIVYGPKDLKNRIAVVSFNIKDKPPDEAGRMLDRKYKIMTRVGLHCAPSAHKAINTFNHGTVRISLGIMNTSRDAERIIRAVNALTK